MNLDILKNDPEDYKVGDLVEVSPRTFATFIAEAPLIIIGVHKNDDYGWHKELCTYSSQKCTLYIVFSFAAAHVFRLYSKEFKILYSNRINNAT